MRNSSALANARRQNARTLRTDLNCGANRLGIGQRIGLWLRFLDSYLDLSSGRQAPKPKPKPMNHHHPLTTIHPPPPPRKPVERVGFFSLEKRGELATQTAAVLRLPLKMALRPEITLKIKIKLACLSTLLAYMTYGCSRDFYIILQRERLKLKMAMECF